MEDLDAAKKQTDTENMEKLIPTSPVVKPPQKEVTHYFNVGNAKRVAYCILIGFVLYHGAIHLKYGRYNYYLANSIYLNYINHINIFSNVDLF